jgi:hypothetical protein
VHNELVQEVEQLDWQKIGVGVASNLVLPPQVVPKTKCYFAAYLSAPETESACPRQVSWVPQPYIKYM